MVQPRAWANNPKLTQMLVMKSALEQAPTGAIIETQHGFDPAQNADRAFNPPNRWEAVFLRRMVNHHAAFRVIL